LIGGENPPKFSKPFLSPDDDKFKPRPPYLAIGSGGQCGGTSDLLTCGESALMGFGLVVCD